MVIKEVAEEVFEDTVEMDSKVKTTSAAEAAAEEEDLMEETVALLVVVVVAGMGVMVPLE